MRRFGRRQFFALGGGAALGASLTALSGVTASGSTDEAAAGADEAANPKRGGQQVVWSVATDRPVAALTFDDGPHPELTPRVLDLLDRHRVPASFFMMGHCAERYPDLAREVVAAGHDVGNHSWRHRNLAHSSAAETRREIEVGAEKIEQATGVAVQMFRPPRGRLNEAALRVLAPLRQDIVLWSVTRGALAERSPSAVASYVVDRVGPGDIVDFHDGIGAWTVEADHPRAAELMERRLVELDALPEIVERVVANGVELVRLSELLPARPATAPEAV